MEQEQNGKMTKDSGQDGESVMRQIDRTEVELKSCYHRLETLERNLQFRPMTMEEREAMEQDVDQLKSVLKAQEENLQKLRHENRFSLIFAVVLLIGTLFFYGVYSMILGPRK